MTTHLRLDMYLNGHEFFIADAPATVVGFEMCLNASDAINTQIAEEIRSDGATAMTPDMLTEDMLDVLYETTGKDINPSDEITFCMCLWDDDEHLQSMISQAQL